MTGRVYDINGIAPALRTFTGGNTEVKIEEPTIIEDFYKQRPARQFSEAPTIRAKRAGLKVQEPITERFYAQALQTAENNTCTSGDVIDAYNKRVNHSGNSPTVTTRPDGFKTAILPIDHDYRIRKLTPRECWRLMDFDDEDFDKIKQAGISDARAYEQAGNSIVVGVLEAIFKNLL
jgi:DNA (cytosine-5)-methyltransferase 1